MQTPDTIEVVELKSASGKIFFRCTVIGNYIFQDWIGDYLTLDEVIDGANTGLELCKKYAIHLILNDNRNLNGSWDHAADWIGTDYMPRAIALNIKLAHIYSPDVFAALSAQEWVDSPVERIETQFFDDEESALEWLLK